MTPTDEWMTLLWLFNSLNEEYGFTIDACATDSNHLLPRYWTIKDDCKKQDWTDEIVFINPPYSQPNLDQIIPYCAAFKAWHVVAIIPATPNTGWFHQYIYDRNRKCWRPGVEVDYPKRRVAFVDPISGRGSPRHDTMIVHWDKGAR